MRKIGIVVAIMASIGMTKGQELKTMLDSAAYAMGSQMGEYYFLNQIDINVDAFYAGLKDGYTANKLKIQEPQKSEAVKAFQEHVQKKQMEQSERESRFNSEVAKSILEQNRQNKDIKQTGSGLQYQVIKEGKGKKPTTADKVKVHYVGTLFNGTVFDSSKERGTPIEFGVTQVIAGWTEGLQLMTEGSTYKFWIPAELGYGNRPVGSIPAGSLLIFEVELLEVSPQ